MVQVADGGDGPQIWRIAANTMNMQRHLTRGGPPSGGWMGANISP